MRGSRILCDGWLRFRGGGSPFAFFLALGVLLASAPPDSRAGSARKENLDLPYRAVGSNQEEEEAPEVLFFYGQAYEASAVVFALDESHTMVHRGRWVMQRGEIHRAMTQLSDKAEFGLVLYGNAVSAFRPTPVLAGGGNRQAALAWVNARAPRGNTHFVEGVVKSLEIVRKSQSEHRMVIVTSDGTSVSGTPESMERAIQRTAAANPRRDVKLHTVWVGSGTDMRGQEFMQRLAKVHGGSFKAISR